MDMHGCTSIHALFRSLFSITGHFNDLLTFICFLSTANRILEAVRSRNLRSVPCTPSLLHVYGLIGELILLYRLRMHLWGRCRSLGFCAVHFIIKAKVTGRRAHCTPSQSHQPAADWTAGFKLAGRCRWQLIALPRAIVGARLDSLVPPRVGLPDQHRTPRAQTPQRLGSSHPRVLLRIFFFPHPQSPIKPRRPQQRGQVRCAF